MTLHAVDIPWQDTNIGCRVCGLEACERHVSDQVTRSDYQRDGAAKAYTLAELGRVVFPARQPILERNETVVLREGHLAMIFAERGIGKSWLALTLGLVAASCVPALGFSAREPSRVLLVDGEMGAEETQSRCAELLPRLRIPATIPFTIIGADWQDTCLPRIDTQDGQAYIEAHVQNADLIIFDNRSCLVDPEAEKDPTRWQPMQDYLLSLRRRGKGVIVVHHSNRLGGARGHSKAEDVMNLLVGLTRPEDYSQDQGARFLVTFQKSRGAYGAAVAPFIAQLTAAGWEMSSAEQQQDANVIDRLLAYLEVAHKADERPKSANAAIGGAKVNRKAGLKAWAELKAAHRIREHHDGGWFPC